MEHFTYRDFFADGESIFVEKQIHNLPLHEHTHEFIEIVYVCSGNGIHVVDGKKYFVKEGCVIFINYNQTHSLSGNNMVIYNILLKPEAISNKIINMKNAFEILSLTAFSEFQSLDLSTYFVCFDEEERNKIEVIVEELCREYNEKLAGSETIMKGYISVLLAYIFRKLLGRNHSLQSISEEENAEILTKITAYIQENFREKLSVELLAEKCFYSPKYFSRIFKACYGMTVTEYIQQMRVRMGCKLLRETNLSVDEISRMIGYNDNVRFYKYFKKRYGVTPNEYRKTNRL